MNFISKNELLSVRDSIKKVFFYRICGTGMGAAACLLKEKGFVVEGADTKFYPPMSTYLQRTAIPCHKTSDLKDEYLKDFDLIVVGNVVAKNSDDAKRLEALGVPLVSFPSALGAFILKDVNVVGIAGTHGKTTTTYFFVKMFENLGEKPGYFIGGVMDDRPSSALGDGKYFFIESDEYDSAYFEKISKFRLYELDHLILTSLEYDHADIFSSLRDIEIEFEEVLKTFKGSMIFNGDYESNLTLLSKFAKNSSFNAIYGVGTEIGPKIIHASGSKTEFSLNWQGNPINFSTNVSGQHNINNLSACLIFALSQGYSAAKLQEAVQDLKLVKRRQELRGQYKGVDVIDDFAHHPRAIKETLSALKLKYPDKKLFVVAEPNSATARSDLFQAQYPESFKDADYLILAKPERSTIVKNVGDLNCDKVLQEWAKMFNRAGFVSTNLHELVSHIDAKINQDSVLIILSNGTCQGLWESDFVKEIS